MLTQVLFGIVASAIVLNWTTVLLSIARPDLRVWPPPRKDSWQHRFNGVLVFTALIGFVLVGILDRGSLASDHWARLPLAGMGMACSLFALWGYLTLGVHASQGLGSELVTGGAYRYSRNPQYVGTIPALLGYALICDSMLALTTAALLTVLFVLVIFAEEAWCREHLGEAFETYAAQVPRFLRLRSPRPR